MKPAKPKPCGAEIEAWCDGAQGLNEARKAEALRVSRQVDRLRRSRRLNEARKAEALREEKSMTKQFFGPGLNEARKAEALRETPYNILTQKTKRGHFGE